MRSWALLGLLALQPDIHRLMKDAVKMEPQKFRKKPVVIEAIQFTGSGDSCDAVAEFLGGYDGKNALWKSCTYEGGFILTLEGKMEFSRGYWIIKGVGGEFYPCKPDIFEKSYDIADPTLNPDYYCDICPHAMWAHNADGSCGCGMDCANERKKAGK